jgi:hypothetical protein
VAGISANSEVQRLNNRIRWGSFYLAREKLWILHEVELLWLVFGGQVFESGIAIILAVRHCGIG